MRHPRAARLVPVLMATVAAAQVFGSTFIRLDVPELARQADRGIYRGRVEGMSSSWNAERTMIWTEARLLVTEDLAGDGAAGETVVFRVPGGRVGDKVIQMEGAPEFRTGEEVVVFATSWPDGSLHVHGYFQGLSAVRLGADGSLVLAGGAAGGMTLEELRRTVGAARAGR